MCSKQVMLVIPFKFCKTACRTFLHYTHIYFVFAAYLFCFHCLCIFQVEQSVIGNFELEYILIEGMFDEIYILVTIGKKHGEVEVQYIQSSYVTMRLVCRISIQCKLLRVLRNGWSNVHHVTCPEWQFALEYTEFRETVTSKSTCWLSRLNLYTTLQYF